MNLEGKTRKLELIICNDFKSRLFGNMFKNEINNVLCFPKCNSVHTFFMKLPIDIIMLDKNKKVINIINSIKPYKIIFPKKNVYYILEFPKNENIYKLNDIVEF